MTNKVPEDPDIGDKKGSQPKKYHSNLSKSTKEKRDAHFKRGAKMDDDNPSAYTPAPGDKGAKTKASVHTQKFRQMYGEEVTQKQIQDLEKFADRLLQKFNIDVEFTRHFADRMNDPRNVPQIKISELQQLFKKISRQKGKEIRQNPNIEAVLKDIQSDLNLPIVINYDKNKDEFEIVNKTIMRKKDFKTPDKVIRYEEVQIDESSEEGLKNKAEKSGVSVGILRQVYNRGMAAWRTGHRPGTTPQQWGMARVNSFLTGGKTRTTADADLWKKAKTQKEELSFDKYTNTISVQENSNMKFNIQEAVQSIKLKKIAKTLSAAARKDRKVADLVRELDKGKMPNVASFKNNDDVVSAFAEVMGPEDTMKLFNIKEGYDAKPGGTEYGTKKSVKYAKKTTPGEKNDVDEAKFSVDIEGLPRFYMDSDSPGKVKQTLRAMLKKPGMIKDVERAPDSKVKADFRSRAAGKKDEPVDEAKKMKGENPCWDGYEMKGKKMKNGKEVPNCVPKEETEMKEAKDKFDIYHKDFSSAVQHARKQAEKRGYTVDDDEWFRNVASGPRRPGTGKTNSYNIELLDKNGKSTRKKLSMQVYNTGKSYELNMYTEETDTSEKVEMAETQLYFIGYACDEILDYIEMGGEIEEWYQNKLSKVHSDMEGLHSYIEGEMRRTGMKEEVELSEKSKATGLRGDGSANYTLGNKPDRDYQFKVVAKKLGQSREVGVYQSLGDAQRVAKNNRKDGITKTQITRIKRKKLAGPVGKLPEEVELSEKKLSFRPLSKPKEKRVGSDKAWMYDISQEHEGKKVAVVQASHPKKPTADNIRRGTVVGTHMVSGQYYHNVKFDDGSSRDIPIYNVYLVKEEVDLDEQKGFKNKATASKGGSRSGQNRWDDAYRKLNVELEKAKKTGDTKKVELLNKKKDDMLDKKYPSLSESELNEKSVSQAQQKLMGMALKYKRGEMDDASDEVKKLASSMSEKDLEDFAKTKHEGLPMKKESITSFKTFTIQEKKKLSAAQLKHMDVDDDNDIDAEDLKQIRNKKKEEK